MQETGSSSDSNFREAKGKGLLNKKRGKLKEKRREGSGIKADASQKPKKGERERPAT